MGVLRRSKLVSSLSIRPLANPLFSVLCFFFLYGCDICYQHPRDGHASRHTSAGHPDVRCFRPRMSGFCVSGLLPRSLEREIEQNDANTFIIAECNFDAAKGICVTSAVLRMGSYIVERDFLRSVCRFMRRVSTETGVSKIPSGAFQQRKVNLAISALMQIWYITYKHQT